MGGWGEAWSNDALSDERDDDRLLMPVGIFFVVIGGWLLSRWTDCSVVLGFVKGRWVLLLRFKVTSRKLRQLMICLLASIVIRSPFWLRTRHISFLMFSVSLGATLEMARPSPL